MKGKFAIIGLIACLFAVFLSLKSYKKSQPDRGRDFFCSLNVDSLLSVITNPYLDEIIIDYEGFIVSFNREKHLPNWVAWKLTRDMVSSQNSLKRKPFREDNLVEGCALLADYKGSGYERGHMAPVGDMKWSERALEHSSYLTNVVPQSHDLNNGAWKNLEEKCRANVMEDSVIVIVCGPVFTDGMKYIGITPIPVPEYFFKVIISPYSPNGPQGIGFVMKNGYIDGGMQKASKSIDYIEALTGHDFFSFLPDSIEDFLEKENDFHRFSSRNKSR